MNAPVQSPLLLVIDRRDRLSIATSIERLINLLDELDGDPDLEDGGEGEPSLGWCDGSGPRYGGYDDREADPADHEPWLGAPDDMHQGRSWSVRDRADREFDEAERGIGDADGLAEQCAGMVYGWYQGVG